MNLQNIEIDERILESSTPIEVGKLELKLNKPLNPNDPTLIDQIDSKISFLQNKKEKIDDSFNHRIIEFTDHGQRDTSNILNNAIPPLDSAKAVNDNISNIAGQLSNLTCTMQPFANLQGAAQKRDKLKILKKSIIHLKKYYELYEQTKYHYEHREFFKVALLVQQVKNMNFEDISLFEKLLSNFPKAINDELFRICQTEFSVSSLFECLICVKNPLEVLKIIMHNTDNFKFSKITNFESDGSKNGIIETYKYRFDVIYTIFKFKSEKSILTKDGAVWNFPSTFWNILTNKSTSEPSILDTIKISFKKFLLPLESNKVKSFLKGSTLLDATNMMNFFNVKWKKIESLLLLTDSYFEISCIIVNSYLAKLTPSLDNSDLIKKDLLDFYQLYKNELNNSDTSTSSCIFIQNVIETIYYLLIYVLISHPFNSTIGGFAEIINFFNCKINKLIENTIIDKPSLDKLLLSHINNEQFSKAFENHRKCPFVAQRLIEFIEIVKKEESNVKLVFSQDFSGKVINFLHELQYFLIPYYFSSSTVSNCCSNESVFRELRLDIIFGDWAKSFKVQVPILRKVALAYFKSEYSNIRKGFFSNYVEPETLFNSYLPI